MVRLHQLSWKLRLLGTSCFLCLLLVFTRYPLEGQEQSAANPPSAEGEDVVSLESGPIHEAFAESVALEPEAGIVVEQQPPEPVPELPPETRPQGDHVEWLPGYWAWSDDAGDFIWISGIWRDIPPNQQWVPGYWTETGEGYQWTRGFWTSAETGELVYLPPPPESLETQPTSPQPGSDYFWVPGCWQWTENQYYWRGGYWHPIQENWIWVPSHYHYTPRGYVFGAGYWDYPLGRRGLLFAPVQFRRPIYRQGGYFYTPNSWIDVASLATGLFVAPRYGHYFYGNYYGPQYASAGIYPWYQYHNRRFGYDPLFAYASWQNGGRESDWFNNLRNDYRHRGTRDPDEQRDRPDADRGADDRAQPDGRPARGDRDQTQFVHNLDELREQQGSQLTRIDEAERRRAVEDTRNRFGEFRRQRADSESQRGQQRPVVQDQGRGRAEGDRQPDAATPSRNRPQPERPNADQPDRSDRPQTAQPRTDQPRRVQPGGDRPQRNQPQVQSPQADRQPESRPAGPINGRFQFPQRDQRRAPATDQIPGNENPQQQSRRTPPQVPQRPGNAPQRSGASRGQGGADAGAQGIPQNRGPSPGRSEPQGNRGSEGNRGERDN